MKRGWIVVLMLVGLVGPVAAHAQVSAYGEFSATYLHNLVSENTLYGATTGILLDGPKLGKLLLSGDIQGRFVGGGGGKRLDGITIGPRLSFNIHKPRISPFGEFLVGFARFNNGLGKSTGDSMIQINAGAARPLSPRLDAVVDYSYAQYYENGGEYNPKTFSIGVIYHFVKR